jgi:hypothetical protein
MSVVELRALRSGLQAAAPAWCKVMVATERSGHLSELQRKALLLCLSSSFER